MTAPRVWDAFLTERDKAQIAALGPKPRTGFGKKPGLLLIDNYRGVLGDGPMPILEQMKLWPSSTGEEGWEAIKHTQQLLYAAREAGIPVVHITGLREVPSWGRGRRARKDDPAHDARMARATDFPDELAPLPGVPVLRKSAPSAFFGTPLAGYFIQMGVDTVIACGESTSGCLRASVVEGFTYCFRMIVPEETSYDRHEACHAINLFDMNQKYADVLPFAEVLEYIRSWKPEEATAPASPASPAASAMPVPALAIA
jgi:nicotinamidase-related amidase